MRKANGRSFIWKRKPSEMASTSTQGNDYKLDKAARPAIKSEGAEDENAVEIGIDDIFNSSDEDKDLSDKKKNVLLAKLKEQVNETKIDGDKLIVPKEEVEESEEDVDFNATANLQTGERLVFNFSRSQSDNPDVPELEVVTKPENSKDINWGDIYRTLPSTDCAEDLKKVIVTMAPKTVKTVHPHEFTMLNRNKYVCNHCHSMFNSKKYVSKHIRYKHRDVTDTYQCPYCPYKSKYTIKLHILLKHKEEKDIHWFQCYTCNKKFKNKAHLKIHIFTHLGTAQLGDYVKQCTICSKIFKTVDGLNRHVKYFHNKEAYKKIQCQHCEYSSRLARQMNKHIEVYHTTPDQRRTHECEQCDYKTTFEYKFKQHKKTHKEEYFRYRCDKCAFVCSAAVRLKLHQVIHQTTQDGIMFKYRCDKCDYKSHRGYSLQVHKLNHLKPNEIEYFYCYHCDFKAKRKDNLKTHVLKHFKREEVVFQCFNCDFSTKKRTLLSNHIEQKHSKAQKQPT